MSAAVAHRNGTKTRRPTASATALMFLSLLSESCHEIKLDANQGKICIAPGAGSRRVNGRTSHLVRGRNDHCWPSPAQIRTSPIKASGSYQECLAAGRVSVRLVARGPAPVTRFPGSVPGTCFAGSRSSQSPPFAPPAPPPVARLCSLASSLLWRSQTSRVRASSASTPRLPDADPRYSPAGQTRDLPIPAQRASTHARVFDHVGLGRCSR
jgi:hypothetical protein